MRIVILVSALAFATTAVAQDAKNPPKIDFGRSGTAPKAAAKPTLSAEDEKKRAASMDEKRTADEDAKQRAWDARLKRTMSGICRGC
jgi:hypothetical protein